MKCFDIQYPLVWETYILMGGMWRHIKLLSLLIHICKICLETDRKILVVVRKLPKTICNIEKGPLRVRS